ncbi:Hypothetical protein CINCED_3A010411 [Cinara cedri]|uniref:Uncharacterized protein n=1 Tax=Cinara cedri TaxID=506608 RepID=A0A5E4M0E4_9HEMI|nr:Hypothetical protein CINCED_3A010411 [Cinara cedri]
MDEMKQFANVMIHHKCFKERQGCLTESLDHFSIEYPELYSLLYMEIKKRGMEFNDPNKMFKWLTTSTSNNNYKKLHEALIFVKKNNIMAQEQYIIDIKHLLCQAIEKKTNINEAVKICRLIEKLPNLTFINGRLSNLIQEVTRLNAYYRPNTLMVTQEKYFMANNFKPEQQNIQTSQQQQTLVSPYSLVQPTCTQFLHGSSHFSYCYGPLETKANYYKYSSFDLNQRPLTENLTASFESLNVDDSQLIQQQPIPVLSPMLQPNNLIPRYGLPHFNLNHFGLGDFEINSFNKCPAFDLTQLLPNQTVVSQEMDGAVMKWLYYLRIHKYQWFFNSLSYHEIEFIDEDNIEGFITKVNKNSITKGALSKICLSCKELRERPKKLNDLLMTLDSEVPLTELCESIKYLRHILNYPIPNKNCVIGDKLQQDIVCVMGKLFYQLQANICVTNCLSASNPLGYCINKYLLCTMLINENQIFMRNQIEKVLYFAESLKYKVRIMSLCKK